MGENVSATRRMCRSVVVSSTHRVANHHRKLGTNASTFPEGSQQERAEREGNIQNNKFVDLDAPATTVPYVLPAPTWSLSDLNVATDDEEATETARAVLSTQEVGILYIIHTCCMI